MNSSSLPESPDQTLSRFLDAEQLEIFKNITVDYFAKLAAAESPPGIGEAFVQFDPPLLLDYTSAVQISGSYTGSIYITAPSNMIDHLLSLHQELEVSNKTRADMCREFSNVLSGNASHAFGAQWTISVPQSIWPGHASDLHLPPSTFVMPIEWRQTRSYLVVGLHPIQPAVL
jgi:hypothetical protein